jgi:FkbM family methyltransferase
MAILSYAQNREDVLLNRLFIDRDDGFYIDVGACHPVFHSVTKLAYDRGWNGINIEPMPNMFQLLTRERPRDINLHMGLSNREGISIFYEVPAAMGYSTFSREQAEDLRRSGYVLEEHSIPVATLAQVCEKYVGRTIDFLKIDVENYEREVLEGGDWQRFRPRVVLLEATLPATNIPCHEQWESLLIGANYLFAFFDGLNRYYVREEDRVLLPALGVPANVFDDYEPYEFHLPIQELRQALESTRESCASIRSALETALCESQGALADARNELSLTRQALEDTRTRLAPFENLGPITIGIARRLRRISTHFPRVASVVKRFIRVVHHLVQDFLSARRPTTGPAGVSSRGS